MMDYVSVCFVFKQKTAYEMRISDWSSDVCSSDLPARAELEITVAFGAHVTLEHAGEHQPAIGDDRAAGVRDIGGIDGEHRLADQPELPRPVDRQIVERRDGFVLAEVEHEQAVGPHHRSEDRRRRDRKSTRLNSSH